MSRPASQNSRASSVTPPWAVDEAPPQWTYKLKEDAPFIQEMEDCLRRKLASLSSSVRESFKYFDRFATGKIRPEAFLAVFEDMQLRVSLDDAVAFVRRYDYGNKGYLDWADFSQRLINADLANSMNLASEYASKEGTVEGVMNYDPAIHTAKFKPKFPVPEAPMSRRTPSMGKTMQEGVGEYRPMNHEEVNRLVLEVEKLEALLRDKIQQKTGNAGKNGALRRAFRNFDRDGSGKISRNEFLQALEWFNIFLSDEHATMLWDRYDVDGDNRIDYEEFTACVMGERAYDYRKKKETELATRPQKSQVFEEPTQVAPGVFPNLNKVEAELKDRFQAKVNDLGGGYRKGFRFFDQAGKGKITFEDFKRVMGMFSFNLQDNEIRILMSRYDVDRKGYMNFDDFIKRFAPEMFIDTSEVDNGVSITRHVSGVGEYRPQGENDLDRTRKEAALDYDFDELERKLREYIREATGLTSGARIAFKLFDLDKIGRVTIEDFARVVNDEFKMDLPMEVVGQWFRRYDHDNKLYLSFEDFSRRLLPRDQMPHIKRPEHIAPPTMTDPNSRMSATLPLHATSASQKRFQGRDAKECMNISMEELEFVLKEKIRQKTGTSGSCFELRKAFKNFDRDASGLVTFDEFVQVLEWFNIFLTEKSLRNIYRQMDVNGDGMIDYGEFERRVMFNGTPRKSILGLYESEDEEVKENNSTLNDTNATNVSLSSTSNMPKRFTTPELYKTSYNTRSEHPAYTLSSTLVGRKAPTAHDMPLKWHGLSNHFTNYAMRGGNFRDTGLVVARSRSKVHGTMDAFNGFTKY